MKKKDELDENGEPIEPSSDLDIDSEVPFEEEEELDYDAMDSTDSMEEDTF